jgi:2-aminoadipate transaminase
MPTTINNAARDVRLAAWTATMQRSALREMLAVVSRPGILSFAGGLPAPELFPTADYGAALTRVLDADRGALQYGPPFAPLKQHICDLMATRGVACEPEQVFLTTGAQQALSVLTRLFLDPGGQVMLERIVYTGIQQAVAPLRPQIVPIDTDLALGIEVDQVADALAQGAEPAYLYVIPDAHNPLGVSISPERRRALAELAVAHNMPIIEDDPYGFLAYDGQALPPLRSYNASHVFYVGSFSKILAPALRLGWMIVPPALVPKVTVIKEAGDLESSALTQRAVAAYLDSGRLPDHIAGLQAAYGERLTAMLAALERHFPDSVSWSAPRGGMFIWVTLPDGLDARDLLPQAVETEKVAFIPGQAFALPGVDARRHLRLNFSNCCIDDIHEGVRRLARVVDAACAGVAADTAVPAGV